VCVCVCACVCVQRSGKHFGQLSESVTALSESVTTLSESVTVLSESVTVLSEPVTALSESVTAHLVAVPHVHRDVRPVGQQPAPGRLDEFPHLPLIRSLYIYIYMAIIWINQADSMSSQICRSEFRIYIYTHIYILL
jgi:hypothetical protein